MPDSVAGCLFGTAIGDALGLPYEAMNAKRASCLLGPPNRFRFVFGRGMMSDDSELMQHLCRAAESVEQGISTAEFADSLGRKGFVTGYINHTVPVAIHSWLSHPDDWMHAVQSVIVCGGDADTTAAITGAVTGCRTGRAGIPEPLLKRFCDWPRTTDHIQKLADALTAVHWPPQPENTPVAPGVSALAIVLRNCVFLAVVLFHGLRRLLPPY